MLNARQPFPRDFIKSLAVLVVVEFVRGAFLISFLPIYATNQLHISISMVGIAVTAHYLTDTAVKIAIGYLLDRFSSRVVVQIGLLISLSGLLGVLFSQQGWLLILSSATFGVGISPIWLVCLSKVKEEERATQMGLLYSFWLAGMGAGPVLMNFLIDQSYTLSFWMLIVLWIAGGLLSFQISNETISKPDVVSVKKQFQLLWQNLKRMRPLLPGMVLQTAAAGMLVPILPQFATRHLGLTYSQYSYLLMLGGAGAVIGLIPMGKLSDTFGKKWFFVLGFGIFSIALYSLTFVSTVYSSMAWALVLGISYAAVLPAWNALMSYYVPSGQEGLGWGVLSSVEGIGVIIGPILGGWIAQWFNDIVTVWVSAGLLGCIALFYLFFPFQRLQGEE
ncbi:MFS transporter [Aneurinibacillus tyrosinisolvens]|uniref:MFS transporter n=1 Tax=Aneurinibacillus tyrosinisolvens TaxID=1443435 RepID=UPI00063F2A68|nr:MFS transporter [Aneurinibacillus tyrosinisolvens]